MQRLNRAIGLVWIVCAVLVGLVGCRPAEAPTDTGVAATRTAPPPSSPLSTPTAAPTSSWTSPIPTASPAAQPTPAFSVGDDRFAVVGVEMDDMLAVRSGPGLDHAIVGRIPPYGTGIRGAADGGSEADGTLWLPIQYEDTAGWASGSFLALQVGAAEPDVAARAAGIILALRDRNLEQLATFVHPDKGIRFSPYTYVRVQPESPQGEDLVFDAGHVAHLFDDPTAYRWGWFDGSGESIDMTFGAYFERFVYDVDFVQPDVVGFGETIGHGNTINNIPEVYPDAVTVEYHLEGLDPQFAGLDWRSLRLVLEQVGSVWYLVGVVHDEWTI